MVFVCPLCRNEYLLYSKLCEDCDSVRHLMSIYSKEEILSVLKNNLVVKHEKKNKMDMMKSIKVDPKKSN